MTKIQENEQIQPEKKGYASCEWVHENGASLWWVTRDNKTGLKFFDYTDSFPEKPKAANKLGEPFSEIYIYDKSVDFNLNNEPANKTKLSCNLVDSLEPKPWDLAAKQLLDYYKEDTDQDLLNFLFHEKILRQKPDSKLDLPKPRSWKMTAILRDEWLFALMSNKYSPKNPEWVTFHSSGFGEFKNRINQFEIVAWLPTPTNEYCLIEQNEFIKFYESLL